MSIKISRPRILRSRNDQPLSPEQIQGVAPAVFQKAPWGQMSEHYAYIPTSTILEALWKEGFTVHEVAQARPRKLERDPYAKHMLRIRFPGAQPSVKGVHPELVLVNAHDGTARYYLYGGVYRMICSNGLMAGDTFAAMTVAHRGGEETAGRVIEGSYRIIKDDMPAIMNTVREMQGKKLTNTQALELAEIGMELRYPGMTKHAAQSLLTVRRHEDESLDLWTVFNRVQENVVQGGYVGRGLLYERRVTARPIESVKSLVTVNRGLWNAAQALLAA